MNEEKGFLDMPILKVDPWSNRNDYSTRNYLLFRGALNNQSFRERYLIELERDDRVISLEGRQLNDGYGSSLFQKDELLMWFLWAINKFGEDVARHNIEVYLNNDLIEFQKICWLSGFSIDSEIMLDNSIRLIHIDEMPDSTTKEHFSLIHENFRTHRQPLPEVALVGNYHDSKIADEIYIENFEKRSLIQRMKVIVKVLNLIKNISCLHFSSQVSSLPDMPIGIFTGEGGSSVRYDILGSDKFNNVLNINAKEINELVINYEQLPINLRSVFDVSIDRLAQAKRRINSNDIVLDLGIALDALLTMRHEKKITKKIVSRGSSAAFRKGWDFNMAGRRLRALYDLRSDVAHDGFIPIGKLHGNDIPEYIRLTEDIIKQLLISGSLSWRN